MSLLLLLVASLLLLGCCWVVDSSVGVSPIHMFDAKINPVATKALNKAPLS